MIKQKIIIIALLIFILIPSSVFALDTEKITVNVDNNKIKLEGVINEINEDITLLVLRDSDNARAYLDQGSTNVNGEFSFVFTLPNGTYNILINSKYNQYETEKVTVYKELSNEEPEYINVVVNDNNVTIGGKVNDKNQNVTLVVYKESDNSRVYIDQVATNVNGEFSFIFTLLNGTYNAVVSSDNSQYTTEKFIVYKTIEEKPEGDINVLVDGYRVSISGKVNEKSSNISLVVYRGNDNLKAYIDQITTNENGEFAFAFTLLEGTYKAVLTANEQQYVTTTFTVTSTGSGGDGGNTGGGKKPVEEPVTEPLKLPSDISNHWAESYIKELVSRGIVSNYPDNTYKPDRNMTRAEFATIIVKALGLEEDSENKFKDVENHWAIKFIALAEKYGIISGYGKGIFGPDDMITREQMAVMIVKALNLKLENSEGLFTDSDDISQWALDYVNTVAKYGIMQGYQDETFRPKSYATRAEMAVVVIKMLEYIEL